MTKVDSSITRPREERKLLRISFILSINYKVDYMCGGYYIMFVMIYKRVCLLNSYQIVANTDQLMKRCLRAWWKAR